MLAKCAVVLGLLLLGCRQSEAPSSVSSEPAGAAGAASSERRPPRSSVASSSGPPAPFVSGGYRQIAWEMAGPFGSQPVVVVVPKSASEQQRLPVLLAFHGRGESLKSPARGARGFVDDYGLLRALERLESPPLTSDDFGDWVKAERLEAINAALKARPYQGLIVVCPYLPDILRTEQLFTEGKVLAQFIVSSVLPKVYAETPALPGPAHTAVDGVSLGGRAALAMLAFEPQAFSVVGSTQPAVDVEEIGRLAALAARAAKRTPTLQLRLLTSDEDYFLQTTRGLSQALSASAVPHQLDQVMGDHSYAFNRGPGVYEMLLFVDRALRASVP